MLELQVPQQNASASEEIVSAEKPCG